MFGKKHAEVLVVGAGPVGLFAALTLARQGVAVDLVDEEWRTGAHSYALGLHPASLRLLDEAGLLESALAHAYQVHKIGLYEGAERRAELSLSSLPSGPGYVAVMRQEALEGMLEDALRDAGIHVHWNHRVPRLHQGESGVTATLDHLEQESLGYSVAHSEWIVSRSREAEYAFAIGADGHLSQVRRVLGLSFEEVGPTHHYAVFEFQTNFELDHEMRIVLSDGTTNILWPLPDGYCRWSFELKDYTVPAHSRRKDRIEIQIADEPYPVLEEDYLRRLLAERAPWFTGSIDEIQWRLLVRFEQRMVPQYGEGRLWLAGDAAHIASPGGIHSMNMGLREAHDLGYAIAAILKGKETPGILDRYSSRYVAEWRTLFGLDTSPHAEAGVDPWIARNAGRLLSCMPASGMDLKALAGQLRLAVGQVGVTVA